MHTFKLLDDQIGKILIEVTGKKPKKVSEFSKKRSKATAKKIDDILCPTLFADLGPEVQKALDQAIEKEGKISKDLRLELSKIFTWRCKECKVTSTTHSPRVPPESCIFCGGTEFDLVKRFSEKKFEEELNTLLSDLRNLAYRNAIKVIPWINSLIARAQSIISSPESRRYQAKKEVEGNLTKKGKKLSDVDKKELDELIKNKLKYFQQHIKKFENAAIFREISRKDQDAIDDIAGRFFRKFWRIIVTNCAGKKKEKGVNLIKMMHSGELLRRVAFDTIFKGGGKSYLVPASHTTLSSFERTVSTPEGEEITFDIADKGKEEETIYVSGDGRDEKTLSEFRAWRADTKSSIDKIVKTIDKLDRLRNYLDDIYSTEKKFGDDAEGLTKFRAQVAKLGGREAAIYKMNKFAKRLEQTKIQLNMMLKEMSKYKRKEGSITQGDIETIEEAISDLEKTGSIIPDYRTPRPSKWQSIHLAKLGAEIKDYEQQIEKIKENVEMTRSDKNKIVRPLEEKIKVATDEITRVNEYIKKSVRPWLEGERDALVIRIALGYPPYDDVVVDKDNVMENLDNPFDPDNPDRRIIGPPFDKTKGLNSIIADAFLNLILFSGKGDIIREMARRRRLSVVKEMDIPRSDVTRGHSLVTKAAAAGVPQSVTDIQTIDNLTNNVDTYIFGAVNQISDIAKEFRRRERTIRREHGIPWPERPEGSEITQSRSDPFYDYWSYMHRTRDAENQYRAQVGMPPLKKYYGID